MLTWQDYQLWLESDLVGPLPEELPVPGADSWSRDSRTLGPGQWFVALEGDGFDGHNFIEEALSKGGVGFLGSAEKIVMLPQFLQKRAVPVKNTLRAYQRIAYGWRQTQKKLTLCALTGSVGKTTCKRMLGAILSKDAMTLCPEDNFNNEIGVPDVLLRLTAKHRFGVLEMGARQEGDIRKLVQIACPDIVACLNAAGAHVGVFGSQEILRKTKLEILRYRPANARSVCWHDDETLLAMAREFDPLLISFGRSRGATVRVVSERWGKGGALSVKLDIAGRNVEFCFLRGHESWPLNAAAAAAMAWACGVSPETIGESFSEFKNVSGRFDVIEAGPVTIVDDTYNASPDSMISGLKTFDALFHEMPQIVVLGDMRELGMFSETEHRKIGKFCAAYLDLKQLVTIGSEAVYIAKAAEASGMDASIIRSYQDTEEFLSGSPLDFGAGVAIYMKGSRMMRMERIVNFYKTQV